MIFESMLLSTITGICWVAFAAISTTWLRMKGKLRNEIVAIPIMFMIGIMHIFYFTLAYPLSIFTFLVWPLVISIYLMSIPELKEGIKISIIVWTTMGALIFLGEVFLTVGMFWYHLSVPLVAGILQAKNRKYLIALIPLTSFLLYIDLIILSFEVLFFYLIVFWTLYWSVTVSIVVKFLDYMAKTKLKDDKFIGVKSGFNYEVKRKGIHFFLPAVLLIYVIGGFVLSHIGELGFIVDELLIVDAERQFMAFLLDIGLVGFVPVDVLRLTFEGMTPAKNYIRETMRESERNGFLGSTQMILGLAFANMLISHQHMIPLVIVVSYADIVAALVGVRSRHKRIAGRSIDGLLAESILAALVFLIFGYGVISILLGSLIPLLDILSAKVKACDNLVYPVALSVALAIV
ncbi:MAG: hypothetical protein QXL15_00625 [Candidatus Korarchaeota archaeon]